METNLKVIIINANRAYRLGRPIMNDQAYDDLLDEYSKTVSVYEYDQFRKQLHEETGKVKHPYIMGSLNKLKSDEPDSVVKWLSKYGGAVLSISAKVDGISCRLHYGADGKFESATTRGDGTFGIDCTDKVLHICNLMNGVPKKVSGGCDVRGELVIKDSDFEDIKGEFANPRNACAGIMNQKEADPLKLSYISFIAYEVMGGVLTKEEQFSWLETEGFETAWHNTISTSSLIITPSTLVPLAETNFGYPTDGLVISSTTYKAEDKYIPDAQCAFKINSHGAVTAIKDIAWGSPSKDGRIIPVAELEPVEIAGSTISRVTLNNIDWVSAMNIGIGSVVRVIKSGDVIPKVVDVVDNSGFKGICLPFECPVCGTQLVRNGVDLCCPNSDCPSQTVERLLTFIENIGIKRVSRKTLESWGVLKMEDLLAFRANPKYKMEVYFQKEIESKVLRASQLKLFKSLSFKDLAEITLDKIINYYEYSALKHDYYKPGYPAGVAEATLNAFKSAAPANFKLVDLIVSDPRYVAPSQEPQTATTASATGASVCFTGALATMTREKAREAAIAAGYAVKDSVTRGLTYLVTNTPNSGSSKNKKAIELGVKVITEEDFLSLL